MVSNSTKKLPKKNPDITQILVEHKVGNYLFFESQSFKSGEMIRNENCFTQKRKCTKQTLDFLVWTQEKIFLQGSLNIDDFSEIFCLNSRKKYSFCNLRLCLMI